MTRQNTTPQDDGPTYSAADLYHRLMQHNGCGDIEIAVYGVDRNVSLECPACGVVIIDADMPAGGAA
jgi:hypothetical protein